jgi:hypothetical protein
LERY